VPPCGPRRTASATNRDHLRYPSDLTDAEWTLVQPFIPPTKHGGRKREVNEHEIINGIMYVLSTGCQWRAIPKDLRRRGTVHAYFVLSQRNGTLDRTHDALYVQCREQAGRASSPTAAVIDSQSVKSAEKQADKSTQRVTTPARNSADANSRPDCSDLCAGGARPRAS
jgi:transposase